MPDSGTAELEYTLLVPVRSCNLWQQYKNTARQPVNRGLIESNIAEFEMLAQFFIRLSFCLLTLVLSSAYTSDLTSRTKLADTLWGHHTAKPIFNEGVSALCSYY